MKYLSVFCLILILGSCGKFCAKRKLSGEWYIVREDIVTFEDGLEI